MRRVLTSSGSRDPWGRVIRGGAFRIAVCALLGSGSAGISHAERYAFDAYGPDQGLRNLAIRVLHQDRQGFLWVGTSNGLYQYDGHRFLAFSAKDGLPDTAITTLYESPGGTLWVGTEHGLAWKSGARFVAARNPALRELIYRQSVASLPDGRMVFATAGGLALASPPAGGRDLQLQALPPPVGVSSPRATAVYVETQEKIWFGCGPSVCRREGGQIQVWGEAEGVPADVWQFIAKDADGNVWVRSRRHLIELEPGGRRFKTLRAEDVGDLNYGYPSLGFDRSGALLVPTNMGLAVLRNGSWSMLGHRQGLPSSTVTAVLQDAEGSLWLGSGEGLARCAGYGEWETFTEAEGLSDDDILSLSEDTTGGIWAGGARGLSHGVRREGVWKWTTVGGGLTWVASMAHAPDGAVWLTTAEPHAARLSPATGAVQRFGEFEGPLYSLATDSAGHLWAASTFALFRGSARSPFGRFEQVHPANSGDRVVFTQMVEGTRGDLWLGSYSGLFRYAGGRWFQYRAADGLAANRIATLARAPEGGVLVRYAYDDALDRVHPEGDRIRVERVERSGGLVADRVYVVAYDLRNRIWAMTDRGAAVQEGGRWVHFDHADGLVSDDCNVMVAAADGSLWIGTTRGLSHILHPNPPAPPPAPSVVFSEARLGNRAVEAISPLVEERPEPLTVRFSALNLARGSRIQYRYRCIGLNERWSEAARPELSLDYPRAGSYRLEVQARWPDSLWGSTAALAVEVRARWFESSWFAAILLLLAGATAWMAWKRRERRNAAAREMLELVVRERTTELFEANRQLREEIAERERAGRERQRLEEELLQAKRLESVGRLAGGVAHDFNNLLTVINGHCELVLNSLHERDPLRASILEVSRAGERAAELTRRLLAFSRKQILQPKPVSPVEIVSGMQDMLRRLLRADIELTTQFASETGLVMADRGQIESVLINLVVNARDAISGGGSIALTVDVVQISGGRALELSLAPGPYVRTTVTDTGHGMDKETLRNVFEPFFTTKEVGKGTGLGLAMVHGIIKQSGGAIAVQSRPGKGTAFEILLPRLDSADTPPEPETPPAKSGGDESVLLVEDQDAVRQLVAALLQQAGYTVAEASGGREALALLENLDAPPDLLVTDVAMPFMSGPELAHRVQQRWASIRVLFISGYPIDGSLPGSDPDAPLHYLAKPFTQADLLGKIREILDGAPEE